MSLIVSLISSLRGVGPPRCARILLPLLGRATTVRHWRSTDARTSHEPVERASTSKDSRPAQGNDEGPSDLWGRDAGAPRSLLSHSDPRAPPPGRWRGPHATPASPRGQPLPAERVTRGASRHAKTSRPRETVRTGRRPSIEGSVNGSDVVGREVRVHARRERALLVLLVAEASRADRVQPDRLASDSRWARSWWRSSGVDRAHRIERGDRCVRPERRPRRRAPPWSGTGSWPRRARHRAAARRARRLRPRWRRTPAAPRPRARAWPLAPPGRSRPSRSARCGVAEPGSGAAPGSRARGRRVPRPRAPGRSPGRRSRAPRPADPRHVPAVEELRELVVGAVAHAGASVDVGLAHPRGPGADRAVDRQIAADRAEAVADGRSRGRWWPRSGSASTGSRRAMREQHRRSRSPFQCGIDISCTAVMPREAASDAACSCRSCRSWSSSVAMIHRPSASFACWVSRPVGSPWRRAPRPAGRAPLPRRAPPGSRARCARRRV